MTRNLDYQITPYQPEHKNGVAELLKPLWTKKTTENERLLGWKYEENPYSADPFGVVGIHEGRVVGFRGFSARRFEIHGKNDDIRILMAGDTCVDPNHRREGLSVSMGDYAKKAYAGRYPLLMNMSCSERALPGYLRMGFRPLVDKNFLRRETLIGTTKLFLSRRSNIRREPREIALGRYGEIEVSKEPKPDQMAEVFFRDSHGRTKLRLVQDERFLRWRYRNPQFEYVFYYAYRGERVTGYVVVGASQDFQTGYVLDSSQDEKASILRILTYMVEAKHWDILTILDCSLRQSQLRALQQLGFSRPGPLRKARQRLKGPLLPILIRPVRDDYREDDFFISGLDTRSIENWSLKPICSDGE